MVEDLAYMPIAEAIKEAADKISIKFPRNWNNEEITATFRREGEKFLRYEKLENRFNIVMKEIGTLDFPFGIELCGILDQSRYNIGKLYVGRYQQDGKNLHLYETSARALRMLLDIAEEIVRKEKKVSQIRKSFDKLPTLYGIDTVE